MRFRNLKELINYNSLWEDNLSVYERGKYDEEELMVVCSIGGVSPFEKLHYFPYLCTLMGPTGFDSEMSCSVSMPSVVDMAR